MENETEQNKNIFSQAEDFDEAPNEFANDTLNRKNELEQLKDYMKRREQKGEAVGMEKMIIMALQSNAPTSVIETMQKGAGITEVRLAELREQANKA